LIENGEFKDRFSKITRIGTQKAFELMGLLSGVIENVGTILSFEVGAEDAEILSKEFIPMVVEDFINLPKFSFYIKLMIDGKTSNAFSGMGIPLETSKFPIATKEAIETFNKLYYGSPRVLVEKTINKNWL